ncbi:hypothetical protein ABW06_06235 [Pluralibacter gergoviae]|uniref:Uncharacterized protein n=1 Tax=Pluralibacter gergoviae TaxID=61647 RepID=A0A0J5L5B4_PLUGE|nr:hypothetical protein ABW06_06235 [Pluralibacter gergoviae]
MLNVMRRVSKVCRSVVRAGLQQVFVQTEAKSAHATCHEVTTQLEKDLLSVTWVMMRLKRINCRTLAFRRLTE